MRLCLLCFCSAHAHFLNLHHFNQNGQTLPSPRLFKPRFLIMLKGTLLGRRSSLAIESFFENDEKCFLFHLKSCFCSQGTSWTLLFGHVEKRLDWKDKFNFIIYDVTTWESYICNRHIAQNYFSQNVVKKLFRDSFLKSQNWTYHWINSQNTYTNCFYCMLFHAFFTVCS